MTLRTGGRVHQENYGVGEIVDMTAAHVTIAFDDGSVRKFVTSMVTLQPSDTPAPAKKPSARGAGKRAGTKKSAAKTTES